MLIKNVYRKFFLFICLLLILLHPYTVIGKPGILISLMFAVYGVVHGVRKKYVDLFLKPGFVLLCIGLIGVISSVFNDIFQLNHLLSALSFNVLLLSYYGFWLYCYKRGISKDTVISLVMYVIVLNSTIIILELVFNSLRLFIESFLDPLVLGSIDYTQGYRLRGIATSGGAGLSVAVPVAITIALYLFNEKKVTFIRLLLIIAVLMFSVVVIGRTGFILSLIPFSIFMGLIFNKKGGGYLLLFSGVFVFAISLSFVQFVSEYYSNMFGGEFINYAFGFLSEGAEGVEREGTAGMVLEYLTVLPYKYPQVLTGYGFYGGSEFYPWSDSGFSRMFLSVGYFFGIIFYTIIYRTYFLAFKGYKFLIGTIILVLSVAELKEPLLFSGVASRMFLLILVFTWLNDVAHFRSRKSPYKILSSYKVQFQRYIEKQ